MINSKTDGTEELIHRSDRTAGNAWFVDRVRFVKSNEEEMSALNRFNPKKEAFIHQEFQSKVDENTIGTPADANIKLIPYRPDHLIYEYSSPKEALAVFSEIWYDKGWKAIIDGKEIDILRANYVLRAAQLPGGNHQIGFKFDPRSYYIGENISLIASFILVFGFSFAIWREIKVITNS